MSGIDDQSAGNLFVPAYAKINLTLDVLGKREDGYHRLASVMQTVSLHDTLHIQAQDDGAIAFDCDVAELRTDENLAVRAARLLASTAADRRLGARIELRKEVPTQAGLGGGSSDGASVLTTLNALWRLGLPIERLEALAAQLGSDVPFFVRGGTALIEGRGEYVTPLPDAEPLWLVLAKPAIGVPTAQVFRGLSAESYTNGEDSEAVVSAIRERRPLPFERLTNALEPGVLRMFPPVALARDVLLDAGAPLVRMSGSGPTLFALFRRLSDAAAVAERARTNTSGIAVWLTHTIGRGYGGVSQ
jgi:4-diphosphocytidyl-2-C-methyl-D-erythritol kinase